MMTCPRCNGPTIELFTSRACRAECDKPGKAVPENPRIAWFRTAIQEALADPPPGMRWIQLDKIEADLTKDQLVGHFRGTKAAFQLGLPNSWRLDRQLAADIAASLDTLSQSFSDPGPPP